MQARAALHTFERPELIRFLGFVTMPGAGASPAGVAAPFSVTGTVSYSDDDVSQQAVTYLGGGQATFHLTYSTADGLWYINHAEFVLSRP